MHTTKLIVQQITRQNRREPHPGQADSSERKRDNRVAKKAELAATAKAKGITVTELIRQRFEQVKTASAKQTGAITIKAEERWVQPSLLHPPRRVIDDFQDDDRRWKY